jgi:hypothetical protein
MSGRFVNSPDLIGKKYSQVADYPSDKPVAQKGDWFVFKGRRKVYLVHDHVVMDFFDWDIYGSQYRDVQKQAQVAWGISWQIT